MSAREQQIREAAEREASERVYAIQPTEQIDDAYTQGWQDVNERMKALEPLCLELIARRVRAVLPDATAVPIEPTDQGGPGWVYGGDSDDLSDDDELSSLLRDYGEFLSSEDHPAQDLQLPAKAEH